MEKILISFITLALLFASSANISHVEATNDWPVFQKDQYHSGFNADETSLKPPFNNLWTKTFEGSNISGLIYKDQTLYAKFGSGKLYAIDASSGSIKWQVQTGDGGGALAFVNNFVYSVGFCSSCAAWTVDAYDPTTGTKIWSSEPSEGAITGINVIGNVIYLGTSDRATGGWDHTVRAIDATTGQYLWVKGVDDSVFAYPVVDDSGKIYVGSYQGNFYALNPSDGSTIWRIAGQIKSTASPVLYGNKIYAGSEGGGNPLQVIDTNSGKIQPAINQLNALINKVKEDYANGEISQNVRDNLINLAQALWNDLQ